MNESLKASHVGTLNNRLFTQMKDKAIQFNGVQMRVDSGRYNVGRGRIQDFMTWTTNYSKRGHVPLP
jgi:hypothetical protein